MAPGQIVTTDRGGRGVVLCEFQDEHGEFQVLVQIRQGHHEILLDWLPFIRPFIVRQAGEAQAQRIETAAGFDPERLTIYYARELRTTVEVDPTSEEKD